MDSFYDVKGNEVSKDNIVAEFINNYTGTLTDFNEGSEIRNLLEAFATYAMGLEERINDVLYVMDILNADDEYLDLMASQPGINMERIEGVEATGTVTFTINSTLSEELLIPEGTIVTSDTGLDFETVTDNTILPGELSRDCMVEAIDVGVDGNIPANSILSEVDGFDAVEGFTVSNSEPFMGGLDYEEDDAFRERILEQMSLPKFGSKNYYVSVLMNEFPDAHDIYFDATDDTYDGVIIPNTYDGSTVQTKLVQDIMGYLTDENNKLLRQTFNVVAPTEKEVTVYIGGLPTAQSTGLFVQMTDYSDASRDKAKEVINCYLKGGSVSFAPVECAGLNVLEEFDAYTLRELLRSALGDLFYNFGENNDAHSFSSTQNKYKWNFVNTANNP
jgi:uncharacterized protein (DUF2164 family)